jgi:hypothetical protein
MPLDAQLFWPQRVAEGTKIKNQKSKIKNQKSKIETRKLETQPENQGKGVRDQVPIPAP